MWKKKIRRMFFVLLLVLAAAGLGLRWFASSERHRRNWTRDAVGEVARWASGEVWVGERTAAVRKRLAETSRETGSWVGDQVAVLGNGEWIVFRNECVHRHPLLGDIFVGRASNGRRYYSSFHFCCEMLVPQMEGQPGDPGAFVAKYFLREFDGNSDGAIGQTWVAGSSPIR